MVMSCSQRSRKDDVQKISTSVFVTNFPGGYGVRDLWNTYKLYGHVMDVFIPDRRTKAGKVKEFASLTNLKVIIQAHNDFVIDERVNGGLEIHLAVSHLDREDGEEGYDVNDGSHEDDMYGGVSENLKDVEGESDREEVLETNFEEVPNKSIFEGNSVRKNDVHSEDTFGIYEVLNKKWDGKNIDDKHEDSLKYPLGFTPNEEGDVPVEKVNNWSDENKVNEGKKVEVCEGQLVYERVEVSNDTHESTCSGHFKKSKVPHKGGSILELIDDLINVSQTMGYDITGCVWVSSRKRLLIISVYAPQDFSEKKMLWDYLSFMFGNWDGEVVIMGDFNELCDISERFGSLFNKHGAEAFNSFIVNAGLEEVPLGGCSFTWCHKSVKKMSKLDCFLISDNLMCSCPSISSTSLDRFLLDHRPIIMHDAHYDYGPIPFKLFHYCFELDGFDKKSILKAELADLNGVIEKGEGSDADGHRRREVVRLIQEVEKRDFVKRISLEQNDDLERKVSNEEIKRAVWDCGIDKAPGPDGFTFGFYRRYWDIIDLLVLLGVYIKLLLRFWHRLVTVLDDIVDEIQSAFVTDRQILDGPFILNESVHWCKNKMKQFMIFKVDFEKAYNSVIWDFIDDILRRVIHSLPFYFSYEELTCFISKSGGCRVNGDNIDTIIRVLDVFYRTSSLRINLNKSNLMGIFVDSNKVKHAATKIGMHTRLSTWKLKTLSIRGRLTLFKFALDVNSKKPSWIRWKSVLAAKDVGGLGNSLWVRVVKALHGGDGSIGKKIQPRKLIDNAILPNGILKTRWIKEVPIKINVHA
uniref:RNA-directed DNA polymerase, eukaryota n=1 Tax=Tanacetum cinerariifolium TaxID=118510 RepID=A0A699HUN0_TANCI|nr:RNA-directed DNA polymerase, eukaryota [Tanacetum cinerariifolium]